MGRGREAEEGEEAGQGGLRGRRESVVGFGGFCVISPLRTGREHVLTALREEGERRRRASEEGTCRGAELRGLVFCSQEHQSVRESTALNEFASE